MSILETSIVALLALWLLATVVYQGFTRQLQGITGRWDIFRLLPSYRLFTGHPRDFRLFYRDQMVAGEVTHWQEISLARTFAWHHALYHPTSAVTGMRAALVGELVLHCERKRLATEEQRISQGFLYVAVKRIVLAAAPADPLMPPGVQRQFKLVEGGGHLNTQPTIVCYCSPFFERC